MNIFIRISAIAACIVVGVSSWYWWPGEKADNPVEQACEEIIEVETGIDFDLSPGYDAKRLSNKDSIIKGSQ